MCGKGVGLFPFKFCCTLFYFSSSLVSKSINSLALSVYLLSRCLNFEMLCLCFIMLDLILFSNILDKKIAPKGANDIKLINAGKILENNKIVGQCRVHFGDLPEAVITMHVVVQPSVTKVKTGTTICAHASDFI